MTDWQPIETAPRDGRIVKMRKGKFAPFNARWKGAGWVAIEYWHGLPATHWLPPDTPNREPS